MLKIVEFLVLGMFLEFSINKIIETIIHYNNKKDIIILSKKGLDNVISFDIKTENDINRILSILKKKDIKYINYIIFKKNRSAKERECFDIIYKKFKKGCELKMMEKYELLKYVKNLDNEISFELKCELLS
jgi:hypothetical protein